MDIGIIPIPHILCVFLHIRNKKLCKFPTKVLQFMTSAFLISQRAKAKNKVVLYKKNGVAGYLANWSPNFNLFQNLLMTCWLSLELEWFV